MKPGDLVKLVLPASARGRGPVDDPAVVWDLEGGHRRAVAPTATRFPEGTLAVFLDDEDGAWRPWPATACRILIEGRVGWVWSRYLEVIDEAG